MEYAYDLPWTISYVIRKRAQVDSYNELPKDKRPPDKLIWEGTNAELDDWFDRVYDFGDKKKKKTRPQSKFEFIIDDDDIG